MNKRTMAISDASAGEIIISSEYLKKEDASLIVKAVNNHEALLYACQATLACSAKLPKHIETLLSQAIANAENK